VLDAYQHWFLFLQTHDESFFLRKRDVQGLGLNPMKSTGDYADERSRVDQVLDGVSAETKAQGSLLSLCSCYGFTSVTDSVSSSFEQLTKVRSAFLY
jgi:hypothetical protein